MMGPWRFFGGCMWIFPLIMAGMLIIGAIVLIRRYGGLNPAINALKASLPAGSDPTGGLTPRRSESALEILKQRYARGEINLEQFEEMKRNL
jgi:uncharacterized membrane protein